MVAGGSAGRMGLLVAQVVRLGPQLVDVQLLRGGKGLPAPLVALDSIWIGCTYMSTIRLIETYKISPVAVADAQLLLDRGPSL